MYKVRDCLLLLLLAALPAACGGPLPPTPLPTPPAPTATPSPVTIILPLPTAELPTATMAPPASPLPPTATARPSATSTVRPPTATPAPLPTTPAPPERMEPMVTSLIVAPSQPPVVYAVVDARLYRSDDRGASWAAEPMGGLPAGATFSAVAIDYRHPETMYGLTDAGIYRRQGGGAWELVNTLRAKALAVDLENPGVLWAGIYRTTEMDAVIVKSEDGGRTWGKADWGVAGGGWVTDILVNPTNPNILWAVVRDGARHGWPPGDLYRGGRDGHWERLDLKQFTPALENKDSCFVAGIAYDPNANLLYTGCDLSYFNGGNLFFLRSPNADAADSSTVRWEVAARLAPQPPEAMGMARPLAVDAREPKSLFVGTTISQWGQLSQYRILASHDDGATWEALPLRGLP